MAGCAETNQPNGKQLLDEDYWEIWNELNEIVQD